MTDIISKWHSANEVVPANDDWKIVRCTAIDGESFYFMAHYSRYERWWTFFDDDKYVDPDDENGNKELFQMSITHWCNEIDISNDN